MEAYFDNSATTRVYDEVAEAVLRAMTTDYGNPSSMHTKGMEAENLVREARKTIADTLKVTEREIVFTSGGTESNNMALYGTAYSMRRMGKHIITSGVEHASIYQPLTFLEEMGYEITYLPVDENGHISLEQLRESIRKDTILVSIMYVNNEIGAVEPVEEIAKVIHETNPRTVFHVEAMQAYGKYRIRPKKMGIDLLSVSGHKIHGPKGTGFLYIGEKIHVHPIILGGGQQRDMRSGTENVPGCYGLGVAAKMAYTGFEKRIDRFYELRDRLISGLHEIEGTTVNGFGDRRNAPQIVSCSFDGIRAEVLLHALERKEIYVSSGSACSSNHPGISGTLKAIGVKKELLDSTLRFSLGSFNNEEQIDYVIAQLKEILPELRKFRRY